MKLRQINSGGIAPIIKEGLSFSEKKGRTLIIKKRAFVRKSMVHV